MENAIKIGNYRHDPKLSFYNHNFYKGEGRTILETCDDDCFFQYYEVMENGYHKHLGNYYGIGGIFLDYQVGDTITISTECT